MVRLITKLSTTFGRGCHWIGFLRRVAALARSGGGGCASLAMRAPRIAWHGKRVFGTQMACGMASVGRGAAGTGVARRGARTRDGPRRACDARRTVVAGIRPFMTRMAAGLFRVGDRARGTRLAVRLPGTLDPAGRTAVDRAIEAGEAPVAHAVLPRRVAPPAIGAGAHAQRRRRGNDVAHAVRAV